MSRTPAGIAGLTSLSVALATLLCACSGGLRPLAAVNQQLARVGSSSNPALAGPWLALIVNRQGVRPQVQLIDLNRNAPVPLQGLNRADSLPLAVTVDQQGERLAVVRLRDDRTELVLYRRSLMASQTVPIEPAGVPRQLQLSADGRLLAVEVSRGGFWQVDLLELP